MPLQYVLCIAERFVAKARHPDSSLHQVSISLFRCIFPLDVYPKMSQWKNCTHTELSK